VRKRSSYRPKGVRLDNMSWLKAGFMPVGRVPTAGIHLKVANMSALDALTLGQGTGIHSHTLREAFEMALCLTRINADLGADLLPELQAAKDASFAAHARGETTGRFLFTGPEMQAVKLGMEIHIQQLDACTVQEMERALLLAVKEKQNEAAA
jgi:hypothetical protein